VTVAIFESGCIITGSIMPEDAEVVRSFYHSQTASGRAAYIIKEDPKIIMADTPKIQKFIGLKTRPLTKISACNQHGHSTEYAQ
jgi:hypothetical protein